MHELARPDRHNLTRGEDALTAYPGPPTGPDQSDRPGPQQVDKITCRTRRGRLKFPASSVTNPALGAPLFVYVSATEAASLNSNRPGPIPRTGRPDLRCASWRRSGRLPAGEHGEHIWHTYYLPERWDDTADVPPLRQCVQEVCTHARRDVSYPAGAGCRAAGGEQLLVVPERRGDLGACSHSWPDPPAFSWQPMRGGCRSALPCESSRREKF